MSSKETISIDAANKMLGMFGVKESRKYERWLKDYGFDLKDFDEVLFESPYIFIVDWRAFLPEEMERIAEALNLLGVDFSCELDSEDESEEKMIATCSSKSVPLLYRPKDDDFTDVIRLVQSIVPENIEFRASPFSEGSDTYVFAVLPHDEWQELESGATKTAIKHYFKAL
jgi:hypothetical protein